MALNIGFPGNEPEYPDPFKPHDLAARATDATQSRKFLEEWIRKYMNHPIQRKLFEASQNKLTLLCGFLTIGFLFIVYWEWTVSQEIYEVLFPERALIPLIGLIVFAFYASVCLGESSRHFSLFSLDENEDENEWKTERVVKELYEGESRKKKYGWALHPAMGAIIASLFLAGIYLASQERVRLLRMAGEVSETELQVFLPVVLYAIEILLGIPAFFFAVWVYGWMRMRKLQKELTLARDQEITLRKSAIEKYMRYIQLLDEYNRWSEKNGRAPYLLMPPSQELRQLLIREYGYDPTGFQQGQGSSNHDSPETPSTPKANINNDQAGSRVDDLLNLVEEQINNQNKSLFKED